MHPDNNNNEHTQDLPDEPARSGDPSITVSRRRLLQATVLGLAIGGLVQAPAHAAEPPPRIPLREALENLTALEAETLDAIIDRILPADDRGPGAREARAIHFIDRSLGSFNSEQRSLYASSLQLLHDHVQHQFSKSFSELSPAQQDTLLAQMEAGELPGVSVSFFSLLRTHTIQGTFSDPYYGGNHEYVGWDLLGYPGIRLITSPAEIAQGRSLAPTHASAYDHGTFTKTASSSDAGH